MCILIFSDTHGDIMRIKNIIENMPGVDAIIHAGDIARDADDLSILFPDIPVYAVTGNNDFYTSYPYDREVELGGKRIFITHGHSHGVKRGMSGLHKIADEGNFDLIVYGHTHIPDTEYYKNTIILNPGTSRYHSTTYAVAEIENGKLRTSIIEL